MKALSYSLDIVRGALITARHLFVNLTLHALSLAGIRTRRRGAVTIQYPEERKDLSPRHRSLHRLMKREDGRPRCVACLLCVTVCPSECITVEAAEDPDPEIQKTASRFTIDVNRCCFCGFCVEACPEDAIRMDTGKIDISETSREALVYEIEDLLE